MKITFKEEYLSIKQLKEIETPEFIILTGKNGSGKSHLLQAIEKGKILINNLTQEQQRIVYFDFRDFYLENEGEYSAENLKQLKNNTWNIFNAIVNTFNGSYNHNNYVRVEALYDVVKGYNIPFWGLSEKEITDNSLFQLYLQYKQEFESNFVPYKNHLELIAIQKLLKTSIVPATKIFEASFKEKYQPYDLKKDFLPNQIGKVIWDYYMKLRNNEINEFLNEKEGGNRPFKTKLEFIEEYGTAPWEVMNQLLDNFGFTDLRIVSPEGTDYFESYHAKLTRQSDGLEVEFSNLSSGEKILMALAASIYKGEADNHFPDILLLDEIDASLHPTMIKDLLNVVYEVFLSKGVKVILVTHSPTTVALANDENIYLMNKEGTNRIQQSSRSEALSVLTEGYMTLDEGIKIIDDLGSKEIIIISEGYNSVILDKLINVYEFKNVEVLKNIETVSGTNQLKTLFDIFTKLNHSKKIIFVWDCDYKEGKRLPKENNITPFVIPFNEKNTLAHKGIENAFSAEFFSSELIKNIKVVEDEILTHEETKFNSGKKKEFSNYVTDKATIRDFSTFQPLVKIIKDLSNE